MTTNTPRSPSRSATASFVRLSPKSPSCIAVTRLAFPSPISIRGISAAFLGGTASPGTAGTATSKTATPARGATTTEELACSELRRPRQKSRCPSLASAAPTICYRAVPRPGRRLSSPSRTVSRVPSLGSVPELCELPGDLVDDRASRSPVPVPAASTTRLGREPGSPSLHKLGRKPATTDATVAAWSDCSMSMSKRSSKKALRFDCD